MGSAFSVPLVDNNHTVSLVGTHLDNNIIEEIHETHLHPNLKVHLADAVTPYTYDRLGELIPNADLVVLGVNSLGVDWAADMLDPLLSPETPILMLTKGMEGNGKQLEILPHNFQSRLSTKVKINAIGGPAIAGEVAVRRHTSVIFTGPDQNLLDKLAEWLRTPYYHIWTSTDIVGVEVCVALKNIYALAVGFVSGLLEKSGEVENQAKMHNLAAAIFAQGLWETAYMVEKMGGQLHSVYTLPGAGDLYVTCQGGRNSRMGRWLGLGVPYSQAKRSYMPDDTIEGAELALAIGPTVKNMVAQGLLDSNRLPLMQAVINIVCADVEVQIPWDQFFAAGKQI